MVNLLKQYPEIEKYLDDTDNYVNTAAEVKRGTDRFLVVTQQDVDGQQLLFKWNGDHFEFWDNETIIDSREMSPGDTMLRPFSEIEATVTQCGPSPDVVIRRSSTASSPK